MESNSEPQAPPRSLIETIFALLRLLESKARLELILAEGNADFGVIGQSLFWLSLSESTTRAIEFFLNGIAIEFSKEDQNTLVLRGDSVITVALREFNNLFGGNFLKSVLKPTLSKLRNEDLEIDVNKMANKISAKKLKSRQKLLFNTSTQLLESIYKEAEKIPLEIRLLTALLKRTMATRFPASQYQALTGYFFLRFICPGIVSPTRIFSEDEEEITPKFVRNLVLVAKVTQTLANSTSFVEKYMLPLNDFISDTHWEKMKTFFDVVTSISPESRLSQSPDVTEELAAKHAQRFLKFAQRWRTGPDKALFAPILNLEKYVSVFSPSKARRSRSLHGHNFTMCKPMDSQKIRGLVSPRGKAEDGGSASGASSKTDDSITIVDLNLTSPPTKPVLVWTPEDVSQWLEYQQFGSDMCKLFVSKGITGKKLLCLQHRALIQMGVVSAVDRTQILSKVGNLSILLMEKGDESDSSSSEGQVFTVRETTEKSGTAKKSTRAYHSDHSRLHHHTPPLRRKKPIARDRCRTMSNLHKSELSPVLRKGVKNLAARPSFQSLDVEITSPKTQVVDLTSVFGCTS